MINIYNTLSDKRIVSKKLTSIKSDIPCKIKDDTSMISPTIIVKADDTIKSANYLYLSDFGRYYYIDDITVMSADRLELHCTVDVLMSFGDSIRNTTATVMRNTNQSNAYLLDNEYQSNAYQNIVTKAFPHGMSNDSIILMTVG